jgi:hypothetical protein
VPEGGDYSFEGLYRALVDKEKSGFGQCREKAKEYVKARVAALEAERKGVGWLDTYGRGRMAAYDDMLRFLGGE